LNRERVFPPNKSEEVHEAVEALFTISIPYTELRTFTVLTDFFEDTVEFRLKLAHRSRDATPGDSKGEDNVSS